MYKGFFCAKKLNALIIRNMIKNIQTINTLKESSQMDKKIFFNIIFYIILTTFFLVLWIKEKQIGAVIREYRAVFSGNLINKLNVTDPKIETGIRKTVDIVEMLGSAIILVLIIQRFYLGNFLVPTGSMIPTIMEKDRLFGNMIIYKFSSPKREDIVVFKEPRQNKVLYTKRVMGLPGEEIQIKADDRLYINEEQIESREYIQASNYTLMKWNKWVVPKKGDVLEIISDVNLKELMKNQNIDIKKEQDLMYKNPDVVNNPNFPNIKFLLNGVETGPLLGILHNKDIINKLVNGEEIRITLEEDYYFCLGDNTSASSDSRVWGFVEESRFRGKPFFRFWPVTKMGFIK